MNQLPCTNPFGAPVYHEETVSSTMDVARHLARQGEPHGTVITADFQETGRGRLRRPWNMDRGRNLSFTILLRYPGFSAIPPALTLRTGLAVSLAIEDFLPPLTGLVQVKWPNDIMLLSKTQAARKAQAALKAAGILTEAEGTLVYIGIGINLAQREFPEELRRKAGSLLSVFEENFPGEKAPPPLPDKEAPLRLLEKILPRLREELETPPPGAWKTMLEQRLYKRGERVTFIEGAAGSDRLIEGRLEGIGGGGELLITPDGAGKPRPFITGELRVY